MGHGRNSDLDGDSEFGSRYSWGRLGLQLGTAVLGMEGNALRGFSLIVTDLRHRGGGGAVDVYCLLGAILFDVVFA